MILVISEDNGFFVVCRLSIPTSAFKKLIHIFKICSDVNYDVDASRIR